GQPVAALRPPLAPHDPRLAEGGQDVLEEVDRDALGLGDAVALDRPLPRPGGEVHGGPHRIVDLGCHAHQAILTRAAIGTRHPAVSALPRHPARPLPPSPGTPPGHFHYPDSANTLTGWLLLRSSRSKA